MGIGSSTAIATSLQMQSTDYAPSEIIEVAKAIEADCRLTTPQQQGLVPKGQEQPTMTKHPAAAATAATAAGVAAETAASKSPS